MQPTNNNVESNDTYSRKGLGGKILPWFWVPSLSFSDELISVIVTMVSLIFFKQMGLGNGEITFYTSWLSLPWVLKPLWSPFIDLVKTKRWWVLAMQILIGASLGGIAFTIPTAYWMQCVLFLLWVIAFGGASFCVAADGFYMLGLDSHQQALFMGIRSLAGRLAAIFGQGVLVMVAGNLQVVYRNSISYSWSLVFYGLMGLFILLWLWHKTALPHAKDDVVRPYVNARTIWRESIKTYRTFFAKPQVAVALLFFLLFRLPEGMLSKVSSLFLIDAGSNGGLGLSPQEFGFVQGTVGVVGVTLGGILGGFAASRHGLRRWLWPMVGALTLPSLVYLYLGYALPESLFVVNVCVFVEQFGYGFGLTAATLYIIYYSRGEFRTSHYVLGSAMMSLSMMLPGTVAGTLQELMGYRHFFLLTLALCAVMFVLAAVVKIDPAFGKSQEPDDEA